MGIILVKSPFFSGKPFIASARDLPNDGDGSRSGSFVQIYQIPWPQFLTDWKERVALALVSWTAGCWEP